MGFIQNIAKKAGCKAARRELDALKKATEQFPERSVEGIFQAVANLRPALSENLPQPYNLAFTVAVISPRHDIQEKEQLRKGIALLLPILTDLEQDSEDITTKWAVHFWRVVLMTMLHDELYEEGRQLWKLIAQRIADENHPIASKRPFYYL
jgi:hypothetical protein